MSAFLGPTEVDFLLLRLQDRMNVLEQTAILPPGLITYCPGVVPNGWLYADGSTISATRYGQLVAYLGGTTLPDLRGRVPVGMAASGTFATLLSTGGVETVTLTGAQSGQPGFTTSTQSANHNHVIFGGQLVPVTTAVAQVAAGGSFAAINNWGTTTDVEAQAHTHSVSAANAASSHSNLQPYIVMLPIIKF